MNIKCTLDNKQYQSKPQDREIGVITNRLKRGSIEISIEDLSNKLASGCTFRPSFLTGTKETDWISQQLFALDFDENCDINTELTKCKQLNILPVFGYTSFSHTEKEHKFRLVFCNDTVIINYDIAKKLQLTLMDIFNNCDERCKNLSRLYFGGRNLVCNNYENRINYNEIVSNHPIQCEIKPNKVKNNDGRIIPLDNKDITIIPILSSGENPPSNNSELNYYNIKALRDRNVEYLKSKIGNPKIILENNQAFFDYIKGYNLGDLLELKYSNSFRCILHEDNSPSAGIFVNEEGTYIYHCFSCGKSYNIINMIEVLGNFKSRPKAYKFIREIFNLEIMDTAWQREQKELIEENHRALMNGELERNCPITYKNIKRNMKYLNQLFIIAKDNVYSEKFTDADDNIVFYASNTHICKLLNMSENSCTEISKKNALFAYHKLLNKINDSDIPEEMLKRSQAIAINSGNRHQKHVNYYSIPSYSTLLFDEIETQGSKWLENNYSMTGISREMFYRGEGLEVANGLYPQHKQVYDREQEMVVDRTTTSKSDLRTNKIVEIIFDILRTRDYVMEKEIIDELSADGDIKTSKKEAEKQVKKSMQEILIAYGLKRIRCNKLIKEKYNVNSEGYPFLIVKE